MIEIKSVFSVARTLEEKGQDHIPDRTSATTLWMSYRFEPMSQQDITFLYAHMLIPVSRPQTVPCSIHITERTGFQNNTTLQRAPRGSLEIAAATTTASSHLFIVIVHRQNVQPNHPHLRSPLHHPPSFPHPHLHTQTRPPPPSPQSPHPPSLLPHLLPPDP